MASLKSEHGLPTHLSPTIPDLTDKIIRLDSQYCAAGGFGDVYHCRYTSDDGVKEVAVKAFRFGFSVDENKDGGKSARMIRRELGIWRRLSHPNIVPFLGFAYGFGLQRNASLVSVWMPHGTLHTFLEAHDDRLVIAHRLQLLLDIANGLDYLHLFPMVHGDLSSSNVLVDHNYNACLTDFGCASLVGELPEGLTYLKMTNVRPGNLRWAAPEHFSLDEQETKHTTKSDIYSLGHIALLVLSGKYPWSEIQSDAAVVRRLFRGDKPSRPPDRPIDDQHWALIEQCWSSAPERPLAKDVVSSLEQFLRAVQVSDTIRLAAALSQNRFVAGGNTAGVPPRTVSPGKTVSAGFPTPQKMGNKRPPNALSSDQSLDAKRPKPGPNKKHVCSTCERGFTTSGHLARHLRVHTGERNRKCPFPGCETRCFGQSNLQKHYRTHLSPGSRRSSSSATGAAIARAVGANGAKNGRSSSAIVTPERLSNDPPSPPPALEHAMILPPPDSPPPLVHALPVSHVPVYNDSMHFASSLSRSPTPLENGYPMISPHSQGLKNGHIASQPSPLASHYSDIPATYTESSQHPTYGYVSPTLHAPATSAVRPQPVVSSQVTQSPSTTICAQNGSAAQAAPSASPSASATASQNHGRSSSAPTPPPPWQTIQIPLVYMPSPSMIPMINRRATQAAPSAPPSVSATASPSAPPPPAGPLMPPHTNDAFEQTMGPAVFKRMMERVKALERDVGILDVAILNEQNNGQTVMLAGLQQERATKAQIKEQIKVILNGQWQKLQQTRNAQAGAGSAVQNGSADAGASTQSQPPNALTTDEYKLSLPDSQVLTQFWQSRGGTASAPSGSNSQAGPSKYNHIRP